MENKSPDVKAAIETLKAAGYLIAKIPECKHLDRPHGSHGLITRTASCEGVEPMPHGFRNGYQGAMGWINICQCGRSFYEDDWKTHMSSTTEHSTSNKSVQKSRSNYKKEQF